MKLKTWLVAAVTMMLAVIFAGCGAADNSNTNTQGNNASNTTTASSDVVKEIPGGLQGKKVLVAYYSWSGHTKAVAEQIHSEVGGDIFEIQPEKAYSKDYKEVVDVAKQEMNDNARPAVANKVDNMDQYDVIFVGYPIWWGKAPMFVYTFLEGYNLQGKTVIPFCTSGGSPIDGSIPDIQSSAKGATVVEGIESTDSQRISQWLTQIHAK